MIGLYPCGLIMAVPPIGGIGGVVNYFPPTIKNPERKSLVPTIRNWPEGIVQTVVIG
jgi:hypothetical protein